jgi:arsenite methyltransferase
MVLIRADNARASYGIDAPGVVRSLAMGGGVGLAATVAVLRAMPPGPLRRAVLAWTTFSGASSLVTAAYMLWGSKVGKLREAERLLDLLELRGDEQVLDVGCGRGLLLVRAARRLNGGRVTGVDLWRAEDLTGNTREAALANARAEGVTERIAVLDGDARALPMPDASFDAVVSSLVLHNITHSPDRRHALGEIVRVLRPGGRVALIDIRHTREYAHELASAGICDVSRSRPHLSIYPPVRVVIGCKPVGYKLQKD